MVRPNEAASALVEPFLTILERVSARPSKVIVQRDEARAYLELAARLLDMRVARVRGLKAVNTIRHELSGFLGGRGF